MGWKKWPRWSAALPEPCDLRGDCSPQRRRAGCCDGTGQVEAPINTDYTSTLSPCAAGVMLLNVYHTSGRSEWDEENWILRHVQRRFNEPLLSANPLNASIRIIYDLWISGVIHDHRVEWRDHSSEFKQTLFFKNCAFFVAWRGKYALVMSRPPFWCSRLKCVFVQFHWDDKRPPAAHKLLLLKGVARIRTSVKTKSSLYCFPAAVDVMSNFWCMW